LKKQRADISRIEREYDLATVAQWRTQPVAEIANKRVLLLNKKLKHFLLRL
jgi:hypothetical protein